MHAWKNKNEKKHSQRIIYSQGSIAAMLLVAEPQILHELWTCYTSTTAESKTNPMEAQRSKREGWGVVKSHLKLSVGSFTRKENKNLNYLLLLHMI